MPVGFVGIALLLVCLLLPISGLAADEGAHFDAANKLYEQGKYVESIKAYREMIKGGEASEAVYFNLGNAYYKNGQLGLAVASYRLAERIAPRDPDIQANLRYVLDEAGVRSRAPIPWWQSWAQYLSLREWALITGVTIWLWAVLGVLRLMKPAWRTGLKMPLTVALLLVFGSGAGAALAWQGTHRDIVAAVTAKEAVVRYGPLDDSHSAFTLRDGAEVVITDAKGDWWQVRDGQERTGWLKAESVVRLDEF